MITPTILSTSTLSGNEVFNIEGKHLGDIKDFMLDMDNGCVAYAVLSFGGFLGLGDKLFAVPFEALSVDTERHAFIVDIDKELLKDAPGFDKDNWPSTPDRDFINRIHTHYGYDPYYDETGSVRPRTTFRTDRPATATTKATRQELSSNLDKTPDRKGY